MYIEDFVKTCNLQFIHIYIGNEMCFNTFTQMYSSVFLIHLYDVILFQTLGLYSYEVNKDMQILCYNKRSF